jgi:hypothetical protein
MEFRKNLKDYILDENNTGTEHFVYKDSFCNSIVDDKVFMGALKLIRRLCFKNDKFKNILVNQYNSNETFIEDVLIKLKDKMEKNDNILSKKDIRYCISENENSNEDLEIIFQRVYSYLLSSEFNQWELKDTVETFQDSHFYQIYSTKYSFVEVVYAKSEEAFKEYFKRYQSGAYKYHKLSVERLRDVQNNLDYTGIDYLNPTVLDVIKNKDLTKFKDIELIYHSD